MTRNVLILPPFSLLQLIITGRDAVQRVVDSFWQRRNRIIREEAALRDSGMPPAAPPYGPSSGLIGFGADLHNKDQ
jgi:hypothetical protein